MNMLQDPSMEEIVNNFCEESSDIFNELEEILEEYEESSDASRLEIFGQTIDRVMGAAKSIEASYMGSFCELGKTISYKASQSNDAQLLNIVVAILFDNLEILKKINNKIKKEKTEELTSLNLEAFSKRLKWLADKFKDIERSSLKISEEEVSSAKVEDQKSLDDLLAELGL